MEPKDKMPTFIEALPKFIEFCDYQTLVTLSVCCKEMNEIVHEKDSLHSKSRLIVDMEFLEVDHLIWLNQLALKRKFNCMRLLNSRFEYKINDDLDVQRRHYLAMLFETLGESVYDVKITHCDIASTSLDKILKNFKKLGKLTIRWSRIKGEALPQTHLNNLHVEYSQGFSFMNFADIKNFSALCTNDKNNEGEVEFVLKKQKQLESVYVNFPLHPENLCSTKIKSLNIHSLISSLEAFPFFFKRQPEMKEISLELSRNSLQSPAVIECVLCGFSFLTTLNLIFLENRDDADQIDLDETLGSVDLSSLGPTTLKRLYIYDELGIAGSFISIFQNAERITCRPTKGLKFNGNFTMDPANFKKIKAVGLTAFDYSTRSVPEKRLLFETEIFSFLSENSGKFCKVKIGHENWNIGPKGSFNLSLKFCKSLVDLPKLEFLELYGMIEVGAVFIKHLSKIGKKFEINLHMEQLSSEETPEKRVKLNVSY